MLSIIFRNCWPSLQAYSLLSICLFCAAGIYGDNLPVDGGVCLFYHVSRRWGKVLVKCPAAAGSAALFPQPGRCVFYHYGSPAHCLCRQVAAPGQHQRLCRQSEKAGILYAIDLDALIMPNLDKSVALAAPLSLSTFSPASYRSDPFGTWRQAWKSGVCANPTSVLNFVGSVFLLTAVKDVRTFLLEAVKKFAAMLLWPVNGVEAD